MKCLCLLAAAIFFLPAVAGAEMAALARNAAEDVAIETALSRGLVTRDDELASYEGFYTGRQGACDLVTVRVTHASTTARDGWTDLFNYRVCNGQIAGDEIMKSQAGQGLKKTSTPGWTDFGIPEGIEDFARQIASQARENGAAEGDYRGFKVLGRTVQLPDKCSVVVRILWEGKLYSQYVSECATLEEGLKLESLASAF